MATSRTLVRRWRRASASLLFCVPLLAAGQATTPPAPISKQAPVEPNESLGTPPSDRVRTADAAFSDNRFAEALDLYTTEKNAVPTADATRQAVLDYKIGRSQMELRNFPAADSALRSSLSAASGVGREPLIPVIRQALGESFRAQGNATAAREQFTYVLEYRQAANDRRASADAIADIGSTYAQQASFSQASLRYLQSEGELEALNDPGRGRLLVNSGSVQAWLGDWSGAESRFAKAIELCEVQTDTRCVASAYHARSLNLFLQGNFVGSRDAASAAADTFGERFPVERARALNNRGMAELNLNDPKRALESLQPAAALLEVYGDAKDLAAVTDSLGSAHARIGMSSQARAEYVKALSLWKQADFKEGSRDTLANLGTLFRDQKRFKEAILVLKLSVDIAQSMRTDALSLPDRTQRLLTRRLSPSYQVLTALLIDEGRLAEAQQIYRMLKEQELHEFLRGSQDDVRTTTVTFTPAESVARNEYRRAETKPEVADELVRLQERRRANIATTEELERARQLERQDRDAFERFFTETEKLQRAAGGDSVPVRNLDMLMEPLRTLGSSAAVLQYVVLPDQLRIMLTTSRRQRSFIVPVARDALYRATWAFRKSLVDESNDILQTAKSLHDFLMPADLAAELKASQTTTIMLSLDGELRYIPMAALYDGKAFLIEKFAFVGYTLASDLKLLQLPNYPWQVSAFGMTQAAPGFKKLESVQGEIDRIVSNGRGQAWFDAKFTRDALLSAVAQEPPVLHIASHFSFAPGSEDDSFLLLGDGKHLSIGDLKLFQFSKMQLLTLSACETAVGGGVNQNGREIDGLAAVVQRGGSASVLATLWSVDDASTAMLMGDFYEARSEQTRVSKAEALRTAQRRLASMKLSEMQSGHRPRRGTLEGSSPTPPFDSERPYAHPFYWAPFTLVGNWL